MLRNPAFIIRYAAILVLFMTTSVQAAQFGTEKDAKAMLDRAIAALKENKDKAPRDVQQGRRRV
jgi:hypothetical protein